MNYYRRLRSRLDGANTKLKRARILNSEARKTLESVRDTTAFFEDIVDAEKMEWQTRHDLAVAEREKQVALQAYTYFRRGRRR